jgi:hypothetical protein
MNSYEIGKKLGQHKILTGLAAAALVTFYIWNGMTSEPKTVTPPAPVVKTEAQLKEERAYRMQAVLMDTLRSTAFNPDSIKFRNEKIHSNGACVEANGQNSFGGYTGFQEYCFLDIKGKTVYTVNGVAK